MKKSLKDLDSKKKNPMYTKFLDIARSVNLPQLLRVAAMLVQRKEEAGTRIDEVLSDAFLKKAKLVDFVVKSFEEATATEQHREKSEEMTSTMTLTEDQLYPLLNFC